jgi:hypothetical protein
LLFCASFFALFFLGFLAFFALFFLCALTLIFALHSWAQTATKAPSANLWLLLSLIATESVQESTEILPPPVPPVVMTSLAYIQDQVPRERYFLQGPCFYGQRRLCLALCILSSLYACAIRDTENQCCRGERKKLFLNVVQKGLRPILAELWVGCNTTKRKKSIKRMTIFTCL